MNRTVLIIEYNQGIRENAIEILELSGYKTLSAENGKAGLEQALQNKPDIILCDTMMPELDGYGVLRGLKNIPEMIGIPFIFMTAKSEQSDFRHGMDLGADDYLIKPFTGDELLSIVGARLKKHEMMVKSFENYFEELNNSKNKIRAQQDESIFNTHRTVKKIRNKDMLYMEGDSPNYLYLIISGKIKVFKSNEWGKELIIDIFKEGEFLGYVALLEDTKHKEFAMAIENSEV